MRPIALEHCYASFATAFQKQRRVKPQAKALMHPSMCFDLDQFAAAGLA
jgi:hypothetical protein